MTPRGAPSLSAWGPPALLPGQRRHDLYLGSSGHPEDAAGREVVGAEPIESPVHGFNGVSFGDPEIDDTCKSEPPCRRDEIAIRRDGDRGLSVRVNDELLVARSLEPSLESTPRFVTVAAKQFYDLRRHAVVDEEPQALCWRRLVSSWMAASTSRRPRPG